MASKQQIDSFINQIGPLVQKYAQLRGYTIASTVIAQACLESAYGTMLPQYKDSATGQLRSSHNYFGMKCGSVWKGPSVNARTQEEYTVGTLTNITANFRVYDSMESGVSGYYDFINWSNYANLKICSTYEQYASCLKSDGWATDSNYVNKLCKIVVDNNLTRFDDFKSYVPPKTKENVVLYRVTHVKGLNVRQKPTTDSPVINGLKYKEIFPVSKISGNWGFVTTKNGWSCLDYAEIK